MKDLMLVEKRIGELTAGLKRWESGNYNWPVDGYTFEPKRVESVVLYEDEEISVDDLLDIINSHDGRKKLSLLKDYDFWDDHPSSRLVLTAETGERETIREDNIKTAKEELEKLKIRKSELESAYFGAKEDIF